MGLVVAALMSLVTPSIAAPYTNRTDEPAIIAATVPGVRNIAPTPYGYRVTTTGGTVNVYNTPWGLRAGNTETYRTAYGYRVVATGTTRHVYANPYGYRIEGDGQISRTPYGYRVDGGTLYSNAAGYRYHHNSSGKAKTGQPK